MTRSLFYFANNAISGANNVLAQIMQGLEGAGQQVDAICADQAKAQRWQPLDRPFLSCEGEDLFHSYDFVIVSKLFLMPLALQGMKTGMPVLICQEIEEFHRQSLKEILSLPVPIVATSKPMRAAILEATGREPFLLPLAVDRSLFRPANDNKKRRDGVSRILMVGDFLRPEKAMLEGFAAIEKLSKEVPVQLVLITQREGAEKILETFSVPVEVHYRPAQVELPLIYQSCDVYCCPSHFENFPLPPLEAFNCRVPVVSTRNRGIFSYGIDGVNLLLAQVGSIDDLCSKLRLLLSSPELAQKLVANAFETAKQFDWNTTLELFLSYQILLKEEIGRLSPFETADMERLLSNLEADGLYTPVQVKSKCKVLFASFTNVCTALIENKLTAEEVVGPLSSLRNDLRPYLVTDTTEYYESVKRRYDLCQLMLGLVNDKRALRQAAMIGARKH